MAVLNISDELYASLQERAEYEQLSVEELTEWLLTEALDDRSEGVYYPSPEELAELKQSIAEDAADEAAGIGIPLDQAVNEVLEEIRQRKNAALAQKASA